MAKLPGAGREGEPQREPLVGGSDALRFEGHVSGRQRSRRILPGTSAAQRSHLDTSAHIGEQRQALREMLNGINDAAQRMPGIIDFDSLQVAIVDEAADTEHVMTYGDAEQMLNGLDKVAWGRLKTHGQSKNPRVRSRAMHVLGFGRVDTQPADDKAKEKTKDLDKLLDNY